MNTIYKNLIESKLGSIQTTLEVLEAESQLEKCDLAEAAAVEVPCEVAVTRPGPKTAINFDRVAKVFGLMVVLVTICTACGGAKSGNNEAQSGLNSSVSYYKQFEGTTSGDCSDPANFSFIEVTTALDEVIGENYLGKPILADLKLRLDPEGTFLAKYTESEIISGSLADTYMSEVISKPTLQGVYRIDGDRIILEGLGYGVPEQVRLRDGTLRPAIRFYPNKVFHHPGFANAVLKLRVFHSDTSPSGLNAREYCSHQ